MRVGAPTERQIRHAGHRGEKDPIPDGYAAEFKWFGKPVRIVVAQKHSKKSYCLFTSHLDCAVQPEFGQQTNKTACPLVKLGGHPYAYKMDASELEPSQHAAAIIVAAGRGERAGKADGPKQYRRLGGEAIITRTLRTFLDHPKIDRVVVAIHPDDQSLFREAAGPYSDHVTIVLGGPTRQASTLHALRVLAEEAPAVVLIHDAVRPFVDGDLISRVIAATSTECGVLPAMPVVETLKRSDRQGRISETVARNDLFSAQTPQAFPFKAILAAHEKAALSGKDDFTDDASIAEWVGLPVALVEGFAENIKLTWAKDIEMANQRAASPFPDVRTGNGYDVHAFEPGDHVTLCGVQIPHTKSLSGHSDADVALHALTDALLATCGAGDIGTHFPPSDPQWRGAPSHIFLEHAAGIVRQHGGRVANVDVTLICEAPRIGQHRAEMTDAIAAMLGIARDRISIKATTNEKLGFVGREEGIAAIATASVIYPGGVPE